MTAGTFSNRYGFGWHKLFERKHALTADERTRAHGSTLKVFQQRLDAMGYDTYLVNSNIPKKVRRRPPPPKGQQGVVLVPVTGASAGTLTEALGEVDVRRRALLGQAASGVTSSRFALTGGGSTALQGSGAGTTCSSSIAATAASRTPSSSASSRSRPCWTGTCRGLPSDSARLT